MFREHLRDLLRQMEWADALVWRAALVLNGAAEDAVLRERLHHIHSVQHLFLQVWRGEPPQIRELAAFADLRAMMGWAREAYPQALGHLDGLGDEALEQEVALPWAQQVEQRLGRISPITLADTALQVVYHSAYHRGQVNTRLRELGGEPPLTEFIAWVWFGRPAADWPSP